MSSKFDKLSIENSRRFLNKIDTTTLNSYNNALWYFYSGLNHRENDLHDLGFKELLKAEKKFSVLDSLKDTARTNYEIFVLLSHQKGIEINAKSFLDKYLKYAESQNDPLILAKANFTVAANFMHANDFQKSKLYYDKSIQQLKILNDILKIAAVEMNIGTLYYSVKDDADSALHFYRKTLPIFKRKKDDYYISTNYNNQARAYELKGEYARAVELYKKANTISLNKFDKKTRLIYYENLARAYDKIKDYKNAALYLNKFIELKDSINDAAQNIAINEVNKKFKTRELTEERDRLEELNFINEAEKKQKDSLLIISLILLTLVIISAYLIQKNTRKKQKIAEQAKDLETQKVVNLLKEQELASIDAMIEGQEKERKRIAEDLHDDLGALMATINLHLENVGSDNNPDALDKTKMLLGEAYKKIRNISHVKNAGVIANEGLLVAVKNMASKISAANTLDMEVIAHGLENRLENSLELSLFRTIQELIANIIKHAEATKATIQLTQFEENLNIIVEDNGKGFDIATIKSNGIGLNNIKKRIDHLNGTLNIDSTQGRGTTILMDIPLKVKKSVAKQ
ncbi:MAG: sensor histidine kinase [Bacteroidota bacterium]